MTRLPLIGTIIAVLAAGAALWWIFNAGPLAPEPATELPGVETPDRAPEEDLLFERPKMGGVYAGRVLDRDDRPIHGAKVLLIAYNAGDAYLMDRVRSGGDFDEDAPLPVIGDYLPAGETVTDADGRFRIAADAQARINRVMAHHPGHFLDVVGVTQPKQDLVLRLPRAGRFVGTVVDHESGRPVHGAVVDIYFQQKVEKVPEIEGDQEFGVIKRKKRKLSWLATLGRFIPKVLGPRIYGLPYEGGATIRLRSDRNGHFEIGPLGDAVQLEFVITHGKYKWYDFDTEGGKQTAKRTVVGPGETVKREFRMRKGNFVAGQVVDENGKGVPKVLVEVQSISAYYRHWWYRDKWRRTITDKEGRFRAEGLARGTQQIVLKHDTFGSMVESANAGTDNLLIVVEPRGGLQGTVMGAPGAAGRRKVTVIFESTDETPKGSRRRREAARLDKQNQFVLSAIAPGSYRVWLQAGKLSTLPVDVTIEPQQVAQAEFELGGGGSISMRVFDVRGGIVEPASVRLVALVEGKERAMGAFVSREGEISIEGVAPGRYLLLAQGSGHIPAKTEPFEVQRDRSTVLPPIELREWGFLKFGQPLDESGRPAPIDDEVVVEVREGEKGKFRRIFLSTAAELAVKPGVVEVRARMGTIRFEDRIEVEDGRTHPVAIVFPGRR